MSTITQISAAIKTLLVAALSDIDQASLDNYLPPVTTRKIALVMPPMGLRGTVDAVVGRKVRLVHRIPCEFWVKYLNGDMDGTLARAREICLNAAAELQGNATHGSALNNTVTFLGDGSGAPAFEWEVGEQLVKVGNDTTYIPATLIITVTEFVVLQA